MRIGLIDVDGHNFPNLALMKLSAWHKRNGDDVEWYWGGWTHYDRVYKSKVFTFTPDADDPINADEIVKGGSSRIAAYNAGLDFVGCEIEPYYFQKQEERYEAHTAQRSLFEKE